MFIREVKNRSKSISIQIINKSLGKYKVVKTVGCGVQRHEIDRLKVIAKQEIERLERQPSLFISENDELIEEAILVRLRL